MTRKIHPLADLVPPMSEADYAALRDDIKANGLRKGFEIILFEDMILDGRHRQRACDETGKPARTKHAEEMGIKTEAQARAFVRSANVHRRHLTAEDKRKVIADLLKAAPEMSNNAVAKTVGADDKTVGKIRGKMEARSEIPNVETRTDTQGRNQPARKGWSRDRFKQHRAKNKPKPTACAVDEKTGKQRPLTKAEATNLTTMAMGDTIAPAPAAATAETKFHVTPERFGSCAEPFMEALTPASPEPEAAPERDLAAELRAAEIKISGLESEVEELKIENAKLRAELDAAKATISSPAIALACHESSSPHES
jgi:hypothetical protein